MARDKSGNPEESRTGFAVKTFFFLVVGLFAGWGGLLRFAALEVQGFWTGEGISVVHALAILREGYPLLPSGELSWPGAGAHYPMALGLTLFEEVHRGARFFSAVAGTLLLGVYYQMNYRFSRSRFQALTAVLLLALLDYQVAWSRQAGSAVYLQLYSVASLSILYLWMEKGRTDRLAFSAILAGLAALTDRAGLLLLPVIFLMVPFRRKRPPEEMKPVSPLLTTASFLVSLILVAASLRSWRGLAEAVAGMALPSPHNHLYDYGGFLAFQLGYSLLWIPAGIIAGTWKRPRFALPLLAAAGCYLFVIGLREPLLHYRFLLPVLPFMLTFLSLGFTSLLRRIISAKGLPAAAGAITLPVLFLLSVSSGQFQVFPQSSHVLGHTAPQPEWREAYRWLAGRSGEAEITTLSTYPMWHDIYLGPGEGEKYFLPFFPGGRKEGLRRAPRYSSAKVVREYSELKHLKGFAVFDDQSLSHLENEAVRRRFIEREPAAYFNSPEGHKIFVWTLPLH